MTVAMWFLCALFTLPLSVYATFSYFETPEYRDGRYRFKLDGTDWTLGILLGSMLSAMAWPLVYPLAAIRFFLKREERRQRKLTLVRRRNEEAFNKLKKARADLLRQKKDENTDACLAWSREWNALLKPAHDRLVAERASQREIEARRNRQIDSEMVTYYVRQGHSYESAVRMATGYDLMYDSLPKMYKRNER